MSMEHEGASACGAKCHLQVIKLAKVAGGPLLLIRLMARQMVYIFIKLSLKKYN